MPSKPMRILTIDIETSPHLVWRWGKLWKPAATNLDMLVTEGRILCVAAKWLGDRKVMFRDERYGDMVSWTRDLLDEADAVVHYNGQRFDVPHINREIATQRLVKPSPFKHVDLKTIVQQNFEFASSKLAHVAPSLHLEEKMQTDGFGLWVGVMSNDEKAWAKMRRYNTQDVLVTEQLFLELRDHGWLSGKLPHATLFGGEGCPTCGSGHVWRRGFYDTGQSRYPKYQCQECGSYHRGTRAETTVKTKGV